jgi:HlyD family secretion protein
VLKKRSGRWGWIAAAVVAVVAVTGAVVAPAILRARQDLADQQASVERVTAFIGDLSATTTASGQVVAVREASLAAGASGIVQSVNVQVGDEVHAGDVLVQLDDTAARLAVEQDRLRVEEAQQNLDVALLQLDDVRDSAADSLSSAYTSFAEAQTDLADAAARVANPESVDEITQYSVNLQRAWEALQDAWDAFDYTMTEEFERDCAADERCDLQASRDAKAAQVEYAHQSYQVALSQYNLAVENLQAGVDSAEARLDSAESAISGAQENLEGPLGAVQNAERNVQKARIALEQARLSLQLSEYKLAQTALVAPFSGIVTAVNVEVGEMAGGVLVELIGAGDYEIALTVDEVDIGAIEAGQPATITLESWPDAVFTGEVLAIAPGAAAGTTVTYEVRLSLPESDLPVRVGMTANASLVIYSAQDVLLIPNRAITVDRENNRYTVNRAAAGGYEEVEIAVGMRNGDYTQVLSGLSEGDELLAGVSTAQPSFAAMQQTGIRPGTLFGGGD